MIIRVLSNKETSAESSQEIYGKISINGPVVVSLPEDLVKRLQREDKTKTSYAEWKFFLDIITFLVVLAYTAITALQWHTTQAALEASQEANRLLEESTRGRLNLRVTIDGPIAVGSLVTLKIHSENAGHSRVAFRAAFGFTRDTFMPPGEMEVRFTDQVSELEPGGSLDLYHKDFTPITQDFLDHLPTFRDSFPNNRPGKLSSYLYGKFTYESLGRPYEIDYCYYLLKSDSLSREIPAHENEEYIIRQCPQWNYSK